MASARELKGPDISEIGSIGHIAGPDTVNLDVPSIEVVVASGRLDQGVEPVDHAALLIESGKAY